MRRGRQRRRAARRVRAAASFVSPFVDRNDARVTARPYENHLPPPQRFGVLEACVRVLPDHHQLAPAVELDDEAARGPRVEALPDDSARVALAARLAADGDALRPDRDDGGAAASGAVGGDDVAVAEAQRQDAVAGLPHRELQQVADADEAGDEARARLLVDVARR